MALLTFQTPRWKHKEPARGKKRRLLLSWSSPGLPFLEWGGRPYSCSPPLWTLRSLQHKLPAPGGTLSLLALFPFQETAAIASDPLISYWMCLQQSWSLQQSFVIQVTKVFLSVKLHRVFSDSNFPPSVTKITNTYKVLTHLLSSADAQQSIQTPAPRNLRRDLPCTGAEGEHLPVPITRRTRELILPFYSSLVSPLDHEVQFWPHSYRRDLDILEKVKQRFMKMLHGQGDLPHLEKWRAYSLKTARLRGDLMEVYKYQIRECKTKWTKLFMQDKKGQKLKYKKFHLNTRKRDFFLIVKLIK